MAIEETRDEIENEEQVKAEIAAEMAAIEEEDEDIDDDDEEEEDDDVTPGDEVIVATPKKKKKATRKKKIVYPAPEEGLTWPFADDLPALEYRHSKIPADKFQTTAAFDRYVCYGYEEFAILHLRKQLEVKLIPHLEIQDELRVKIEDADRICSRLNVEDDEQKAGITDILAAASKASGKGLDLDILLASVQMLFDSKKQDS